MTNTLRIFLILLFFVFCSTQNLQSQIWFSKKLVPSIECLEKSEIHVFDFNNDSFPDIFISGYLDTVYFSRVYINSKNGSYFKIKDKLFGNFVPEKIKFIDVNGDHYIDILATKLVGISLFKNLLYINQGGTNFIPKPNTILATIHDEIICAKDIDYDGDPDLLLRNQSITLLLNDGTGSFTPSYLSGISPKSRTEADFGDFDSDGDMDIFIAGAENFPPYNISDYMVYLNDGTFNFTHKPSIIHPALNGVVLIKDFNLDGAPDVYYSGSSFDFSYSPSDIIINDGTGYFTTQPIYFSYDKNSSGYGGTNVGTPQAFCDFNNDGYLDALARGSISLNDGFTFNRPLPNVSIDGTADCGDMDQDGDNDIICMDLLNESVYLYRNELITGTPTIKQSNQISIYPNPSIGLLNIDYSKKYDLKVLTITGQLIYSQSNIQPSSTQFQLNTEKGIYIIVIETENTKHQYKLMIN